MFPPDTNTNTESNFLEREKGGEYFPIRGVYFLKKGVYFLKRGVYFLKN